MSLMMYFYIYILYVFRAINNNLKGTGHQYYWAWYRVRCTHEHFLLFLNIQWDSIIFYP